MRIVARHMVVMGSAVDGKEFTEARRKRVENYLRSEGFDNARVVRTVNVGETLRVWGQNVSELLDTLHEGWKRLD